MFFPGLFTEPLIRKIQSRFSLLKPNAAPSLDLCMMVVSATREVVISLYRHVKRGIFF